MTFVRSSIDHLGNVVDQLWDDPAKLIFFSKLRSRCGSTIETFLPSSNSRLNGSSCKIGPSIPRRIPMYASGVAPFCC